MKKLFALLILVIVMSSCFKERSREPVKDNKWELNSALDKAEKVVIVDGVDGEMVDGVFYYKYKVNRYTQGVVGYGYNKNIYRPNDTVYFSKRLLR